MALAKVYDTSDTLMVPLDLEGTEGLSDLLYKVADVVADPGPLRNLADAIEDARVAAGLDT